MTKWLWQLRVTEAHQRRTGRADWQGSLPAKALETHVVSFLLDWARDA